MELVTSIVLAFTKEEAAQKFKKALAGGGMSVAGTCKSKAEVLRLVSKLDSGIVISGYRLSDDLAEGLAEALPYGFSLLLAATDKQMNILRPTSKLFVLPSPMTPSALLSSVQMLAQFQHIQLKKHGPRKKPASEQDIIGQAKELLMQHRHMTEEEAHRFIQKQSMDSGRKMGESASHILEISQL